MVFGDWCDANFAGFFRVFIMSWGYCCEWQHRLIFMKCPVPAIFFAKHRIQVWGGVTLAITSSHCSHCQFVSFNCTNFLRAPYMILISFAHGYYRKCSKHLPVVSLGDIFQNRFLHFLNLNSKHIVRQAGTATMSEAHFFPLKSIQNYTVSNFDAPKSYLNSN